MDGRWDREMEYQKLFGLTPAESACVVSHEGGLSISQIADLRGVKQSTVRTLLQRAGEKMKNTDKMVTIVVCKGNEDGLGVAVKLNAIEVVLKFVSKVLGIQYFNGNHTFMLRCPNSVGNTSWLRNNVFSYVSIIGVTSDYEKERKADKLLEIYNQKNPDGEDLVGYGIIKWFLEDMYMKYDIEGDGNGER